MIDHGAALYFHHGWPGGVTDPARFAAQPWDAADHVLRALRRRAAGRRRRGPRRCWTSGVFAEVLAEVPDEWLEPVPGAETPDALRAAYVAFLAARLGDRASGCPGVRGMSAHDAGLPVRRAALRAARGPRGVRQRRRGALLPGRRLPRRRLARRPRPAARARPAASTSTRSARRWPSSTACAPATSAGERRPASRSAQRFGFLKAPRSTVLQPGPVHGGMTADPARQLEHLLEQLVGCGPASSSASVTLARLAPTQRQTGTSSTAPTA